MTQNDPDGISFASSDDERFERLAHMLKEMDTYSASSHARVMGLTTDTSNALHLGICSVVQTLPAKGMKYVLTGQLQSDRFLCK